MSVNSNMINTYIITVCLLVYYRVLVLFVGRVA